MDRHPHNHHHHHRHRHHSPPPPPPPQVTHVHHTSHHPTTPTPPPPHVTPVHHPTPTPPPPQPYYHTAPHNVYPPQPAAPAHPTPPPPQPHHQTAPHNVYPPPPQPHHHTAPHNVYPPPPAAAPAPAHSPGASVHHVSHTTTTPYHSHVSSVVTHPHHHDSIASKPAVRVLCKAKTDYSLTIRNGKVILAPNNISDLHQHWIKDEKYSSRVKDEEGFPSFALINKATGQAMKHSIGATHPVQLIPYNANHLDESILWSESKDLGDSYKTIRMVNNIRLNVDALDGDKQHGGVFDGTRIVLGEWKKGENQRWKVVPY